MNTLISLCAEHDGSMDTECERVRARVRETGRHEESASFALLCDILFAHGAHFLLFFCVINNGVVDACCVFRRKFKGGAAGWCNEAIAP